MLKYFIFKATFCSDDKSVASLQQIVFHDRHFAEILHYAVL